MRGGVASAKVELEKLHLFNWPTAMETSKHLAITCQKLIKNFLLVVTVQHIAMQYFKLLSAVLLDEQFQMTHTHGTEFLRASSHECVNQASLVSRANFVFCSYGKFQPGYQDEKGAKHGLFIPKAMGTSSASMGHLTLFKQTVERLAYHLLKKAKHVVRGCIQFSQRPCKAFVVEKDSSQQLCRSVHMGIFPARLPISWSEKLGSR